MSQDQLQRIIDHFHIGKITLQKDLHYFYEVTTTQGKYIVLFDKLETVRQTEEARLIKAQTITGTNTTRILKENYQKELSPENSYTHSENYYYSIYKEV